MLRSERMLNIEKFYDELINMGVINPKIMIGFSKDGKLLNCRFAKCSDCKEILMAQLNISKEEYYKESCRKNILKWLLSEYKEPEIDWSKVKVDTPILVKRSKEAEWERRYFAKFEDGKVYAWQVGATSWTADSKLNPWNYAKLAESEE
jgi:hypothetical protein